MAKLQQAQGFELAGFLAIPRKVLQVRPMGSQPRNTD